VEGGVEAGHLGHAGQRGPRGFDRGLIGSLLPREVTRIESMDLAIAQDAVETKREPFDLAIVAGLTREYYARAHAVGVRPDLGPAPLTGDPRRVERLIANLVDDGLAYNCDPGRPDVTTFWKFR
jgi:hypothetical protein